MPEGFDLSPKNPDDRDEKIAKAMREFIASSIQDRDIREAVLSEPDFKEAVKKIENILNEKMKSHTANGYFTPQVLKTIADEIVYGIKGGVLGKATSFDSTVERFYESKEFSVEDIISQIAVAEDWSASDLKLEEVIRDKNKRIASITIVPKEQRKAVNLHQNHVKYEFNYPTVYGELVANVIPLYPQIDRIIFDPETDERLLDKEPTDIEFLDIEEVPENRQALVTYIDKKWVIPKNN